MTGMPAAPVDVVISPLLSAPGAVGAEGLDAGVAAHYGDPLREQRLLHEGPPSSTCRTARSSPSQVPTGCRGCTR